MTFTTITSVSALDFTNEELDIGDTAAFVTKMNSYMAKIQAQMNQVSVAIGDINTVGAEQSTAASTAAALQITLAASIAALDAPIAAVEAVQTTLDAAVLEYDTAVADFANLSALTPAEATALSDALDALIVATSVVLLTGNQTIAGNKTFTGVIKVDHANATISIDADSGNNPLLNFQTADATKAQIYYVSSNDRLRIGKLANGDSGNQFDIFSDYTTFSKVVRGVTPVGTTDLTTKAYVDDNTNVVQQDSSWSMVMPTAAGTAGQQLEVGSVSGTVVTMVWV